MQETGNTNDSLSNVEGEVTLIVPNRDTKVTASYVGYESITRKAFEFSGTITFRDDRRTTRQSNDTSLLKILLTIFSKNE